MPRKEPLSIAVRCANAADLNGRCLDALRALDRIEILPLEEAGTRDLDLILDLTCEPAAPEHIVGPRFGYWTFLYGDTPERIAPGLLGILSGRRAAFVRLARLAPDGRAVILREGTVRTVPHSLAATRRRLIEAASRWPAEKLRELARGARVSLGPEVQLASRSRLARMALRARLPAALARNFGRRVRQELTRDRWRIGIIEQPIRGLLERFDPAAIRWLEAPFEGFLADPFGVAHPDGRVVILAEGFPWKERRGRIVAIERRQGPLEITPTSLTFESHLSYPQLIEHEGEIYCIPECCALGRVQLFRAAAFPHRWVLDRVLLEGFAGVDTTVIRYRERWWMFTCNHADEDEAKLFIFHADELRGPWRPHAGNPVKCDLRSSRPGGTPFVAEDGALYRPAQDCSRAYGGALVINRLIRLTADEFEEEVAAHLNADASGPCPDGLHTLSAVGNLTLVDGKRHELSGASIVAALKRIAGRLRRQGFCYG